MNKANTDVSISQSSQQDKIKKVILFTTAIGLLIQIFILFKLSTIDLNIPDGKSLKSSFESAAFASESISLALSTVNSNLKTFNAHIKGIPLIGSNLASDGSAIATEIDTTVIKVKDLSKNLEKAALSLEKFNKEQFLLLKTILVFQNLSLLILFFSLGLYISSLETFEDKSKAIGGK